jgi:hypothetical protein
VQCPKCGRAAAAGAFICAGCDFILDTSFLGDDITDDERDQRAAARRTRPAESPRVDFGEDAMILGNPAEDEVSEFRSRDAGISQREVTQARFYIGGVIGQLMEPNAVPELAVVELESLRLTPFERHVLGFVNGKRSVGRIAKKAAMDDSEFKTALAMLADKGFLRLKGFKKRRVDGSALGSRSADASQSRIRRPPEDERTVVARMDHIEAYAQPAPASPPAVEQRPAPPRPRTADVTTRVVQTAVPSAARPSSPSGPMPPSRLPAASSSTTAPMSLRAHGARKETLAALPVERAGPAPTAAGGHDAKGTATPSLVDAAPEDVFLVSSASRLADAEEPDGFDEGAPTTTAARMLSGHNVPTRLLDRGLVDADERAPREHSEYARLRDPTGLGDVAYEDEDPGGPIEGDPSAEPEDDDVSAGSAGEGADDAAFEEGTAGTPGHDIASAVTRSLPAEASASGIDDDQDDLPGTVELPGARTAPLASPPPAISASLAPTGPVVRPPPELEAAPPALKPLTALPGAGITAVTPSPGQPSPRPVPPSSARPAVHAPPARASGTPPPRLAPPAGAPHASAPQPAATAAATTSPTVSSSSPPPLPLPLPGQASSPALPQGAPLPTGPGLARAPAPPRVSAASKVPFELRKKAERIYEQALKDRDEGRLASAVMNAKLAMNFDATVPAYKELHEELVRARAEMAAPRAVRGERPRELVLFEQANDAEGRGEYERAVKLLREAVDLNPRAAALHNKLGVVLSIRLKRHEDALGHLKQAVDLEPGSVVYMNNFSKVTGLLESMLEKEPRQQKKKGALDDNGGRVEIKKIRPMKF